MTINYGQYWGLLALVLGASFLAQNGDVVQAVVGSVLSCTGALLLSRRREP